MQDIERDKIKKFSKLLIRNIIDTAFTAGAKSAHIGGALSAIDVVSVLFGSIMKYNKNDPQDPNRDRFILSKGHACLVYYSALHIVGYISKDELNTFENSGSSMLGHPVINRRLGIEFSNGSLGMGLSLGVGVSLANLKLKKTNKVYVVLGDGECNEGSVWESAMSASHFKLNNLTAIVDNNNLQQTGSNKDIMNLLDIKEKWKSFGWNVKEIDGHNANEIYKSLNNDSKDKPLAIIAKTIKGKGLTFAENNNSWHHTMLSKSLYDKAIEEINEKF
jgi:transketolase